MDKTALDGRARLLAVLAVLLGLIAMHGLASRHHGPASAVAATAVTAPMTDAALTAGPEGQDQAADVTRHSGMHHVAVAAVLPGVDSLAGACADCLDHGAALCLAVLSVGLAFLARLLARRAQAGGLPAPQERLPLLRAGPPLRLRPPDLVSQLCVSRT